MTSLPFTDILETVKKKINKLKYHPFVRMNSREFITI